jgi:hypothetical protein
MARSTLEEEESRMLNSHQSKTAFSCLTLLAALLVLPAAAADVPNQLPDPDGKPADVT